MGALKDMLQRWLGIDRILIEQNALRDDYAKLSADFVTLSNQRTITPVNQPEHRPRPLSCAAIRRLSEQINAKTFDEENHG